MVAAPIKTCGGADLGPLQLCCGTVVDLYCGGGSQSETKQRAEWLTWATGRTWLGSQGGRRSGVHDTWEDFDSHDAQTDENKKNEEPNPQLNCLSVQHKARLHIYCACTEQHVI